MTRSGRNTPWTALAVALMLVLAMPSGVVRAQTADENRKRQELTVSRYYPSMTNPGDIDEYSERNPTTFPKLGELELPPDIG